MASQHPQSYTIVASQHSPPVTAPTSAVVHQASAIDGSITKEAGSAQPWPSSPAASRTRQVVAGDNDSYIDVDGDTSSYLSMQSEHDIVVARDIATSAQPTGSMGWGRTSEGVSMRHQRRLGARVAMEAPGSRSALESGTEYDLDDDSVAVGVNFRDIYIVAAETPV